MAITSLKLLTTDFTNHRIADLPDRPGQAGINANALKSAFDDVTINILAPRINAILDALAATESGNSGAQNIGSQTIAGVPGTTVFAQLSALKALIDNLTAVAVGNIPLDSITDGMLKAGGVKDQFAAHAASVGAHFVTGQTTGTASAYVLSDAAHPWGTISTGPCLFLVKPHADCAANATMALCGGPAKVITPTTMGGLYAGQMKQYGMYLLMWNPENGLLYLLNPEYPAALLLEKIKTVDGSGSGLDADTVGGKSVLDLLKIMYPVYSIYINTVPTNPAAIWGFGTWVAFGTGRALVGIDTAQPEFNAAEKMGGEKTHTLNEAEIPSHYHTFNVLAEASGFGNGYLAYSNNYATPAAAAVTSAGGGQPHNNLQPYITVYMWKRTA